LALTHGTRLGVYEVTAQLGVGGMGEVYRATDTKLKRQVAIKILPSPLAADPDRLARFQREAEVLASLNHPNIAAIYGLDEADDVKALVMELVEGEDLAQRIARGAIPLAEALPIAKQIADALEVAHERGIIHRDLKPANIKVREDGTVKVLDFGLAKAMEPISRAPNVSQSPTITTPAMTQAGMILGTAAYMSPEQAKGRAADKRADIWAFGVVVFEMLTGLRLFTGETISDTLASVLKTDPDWRALPVAVPSSLRRLLRRCLEKEPKRRLQAIGEARVQIEDLLAGTQEDADTIVNEAATPTWRRVLPWASTGALAVTVAMILVLWAPWRKAVLPASLSLNVELGADVSVTFGAGDALSLSPDGTVVAFVAQEDAGGSPQLYVRRLAQLQATPLLGTDDAESPFFSPDGQWIAFFAGGKLRKINVAGGPIVLLCDAPNGRGGTWIEDDTIVFLPNSTLDARLMRVSSAGGTPEPLTSLASLAQDDGPQRWPQALPGGKAVLFTRGAVGGEQSIMVQVLATGARTVVQRGGYHGRYLPSGHLVYLQDGTLFAAPFDLDRLTTTGPAVPALEGLASNPGSGAAQFAVSTNGTLVYLPGQSISGVPMQWMDNKGQTTPLRDTPANWSNLLFAPDGRRLALHIIEGQPDIWVYEWELDKLTRLTVHQGQGRNTKPVWSPQSRDIAFASTRADRATLNLYLQRVDATGEAQRLTESRSDQSPASWHKSGKFLAFEEVKQVDGPAQGSTNPRANSDLMILPMERNEVSGWNPGQPYVFLDGPAQEREPMFSPDGRWLAYSSNESGRDQVYVRPFPGPGGKSLISTGGGVFPTWSQTKHELFYATPNGQIMVAPYRVEGDAFIGERPRLWSKRRILMRGPVVRMFDLHRDGDRIAFAPAAQAVSVKQDHLTFIFNLFDQLHRIAPGTQH
jgi:Tol biopolymer transport system component